MKNDKKPGWNLCLICNTNNIEHLLPYVICEECIKKVKDED